MGSGLHLKVLAQIRQKQVFAPKSGSNFARAASVSDALRVADHLYTLEMAPRAPQPPPASAVITFIMEQTVVNTRMTQAPHAITKVYFNRNCAAQSTVHS